MEKVNLRIYVTSSMNTTPDAKHRWQNERKNATKAPNRLDCCIVIETKNVGTW